MTRHEKQRPRMYRFISLIHIPHPVRSTVVSIATWSCVCVALLTLILKATARVRSARMVVTCQFVVASMEYHARRFFLFKAKICFNLWGTQLRNYTAAIMCDTNDKRSWLWSIELIIFISMCCLISSSLCMRLMERFLLAILFHFKPLWVINFPSRFASFSVASLTYELFSCLKVEL